MTGLAHEVVVSCSRCTSSVRCVVVAATRTDAADRVMTDLAAVGWLIGTNRASSVVDRFTSVSDDTDLCPGCVEVLGAHPT